MSKTRGTIRGKAAGQGQAGPKSSANSVSFELNEMIYLAVITIAAALLAGVLALPFTMSNAVFAVRSTGGDPQEIGFLGLRQAALPMT